MIKVLMIVLFIVSGCEAATIKLNKKIEIESTPTGFKMQLAKQNSKVVIAVIDTGLDSKYKKDVKLCKTGHRNFAEMNMACLKGDEECETVRKKHKFDENNIEDGGNYHGTHVAGLIAKNITTDYCLMIIKWYSHDINKYSNNLINSNKAFRWAIDHNVDMINYSAGGPEPGPQEQALILEALDKNIIVVTAAGNESVSFKHQAYFPALYDKRVIVVGNLMRVRSKMVRHPSSNYGKEIDLEILGTNLISINNRALTGTSQAAAVATGKLAEYVKAYRFTEFMRKYDYGNNYYTPLYRHTGQ